MGLAAVYGRYSPFPLPPFEGTWSVGAGERLLADRV